MALTIRPVRKEELIETAKIYIECFREDYFFVPTDYLAQMYCEQEVQECEDWLYHQDRSNAILGAFDEDVLAGYIAVGGDQGTPDKTRGEVCGLFVRKACRKQGLGTKLIKAGIEYLESLGFTNVVVYNFRQSTSNNYYRNLEGKVVGQEKQEVGGKVLDVDIFGWKVSELKMILSRR